MCRSPFLTYAALKGQISLWVSNLYCQHLIHPSSVLCCPAPSAKMHQTDSFQWWHNFSSITKHKNLSKSVAFMEGSLAEREFQQILLIQVTHCVWAASCTRCWSPNLWSQAQLPHGQHFFLPTKSAGKKLLNVPRSPKVFMLCRGISDIHTFVENSSSDYDKLLV